MLEVASLNSMRSDSIVASPEATTPGRPSITAVFFSASIDALSPTAYVPSSRSYRTASRALAAATSFSPSIDCVRSASIWSAQMRWPDC